jgi:hypothetical protein
MTRKSAIRHSTPANRGVLRDLGFDELYRRLIAAQAKRGHYSEAGRDRRSQSVLRSYRRIIYDARQSSSPISNAELIEKHEEKRLGARERTRTSTELPAST